MNSRRAGARTLASPGLSARRAGGRRSGVRHPRLRRPSTRRLDVASLLWGLLFALIAGVGIATSLGVHMAWTRLVHAGPFVLICLGLLGLILSRPRQ